jgi:hypothetical protein
MAWLSRIRRMSLSLLAALSLSLWAGCPRTALAQEPHAGALVAADPALVPVGAPGFVRLTACTVTATLTEEGGRLLLSVDQTYALHNRDRIEPATLQVGLVPPGGIAAADVAAEVSRDGGELARLETPAGTAGAWQLTLAPNESCVLRATSRHEAADALWLRWTWALDALAEWGAADGLRVELRLPEIVGDDDLATLAPAYATFDGHTMAWEYEGESGAEPLEIALLSPATYGQVRALQKAGAHLDLARLYGRVQTSAAAASVEADYYGQILGELQAAIDDAAATTDATVLSEARRTLADTYEALAGVRPLQRLNYTLLAIRQWEAELAAAPDDLALRETLGRLYGQAAQAANEGSNPEEALAYLQKARELRGDGAVAADENEATSLRWALELARRGRVSQALVALNDVLSPGIRDALLRYAPPVASARTVVTQSAERRTVRYELRLYAPSAPATRAQLAAVAERLRAVPGTQADLAEEGGLLTLQVTVAGYTGVEAAAIRTAVGVPPTGEPDTLTALLAAPWAEGTRYRLARHAWQDRHRLDEQVDLGLLRQAWATQAEYVDWRLVELQTAEAENERAGLENALARLALAEQRQVWATIPTGTYWVYRMDAGPNAISPTWTLGWEAEGTLQADIRDLHWPPGWREAWQRWWHHPAQEGDG